MARARARWTHPLCRLPTRSWKFSLISSNCWLPALGCSPHPPGRRRLVAGPTVSTRRGPGPHYDLCSASCGCSHRPAGTAAWCALRMGPPCASRFCLLRDSGVSRRHGGPLTAVTAMGRCGPLCAAVRPWRAKACRMPHGQLRVGGLFHRTPYRIPYSHTHRRHPSARAVCGAASQVGGRGSAQRLPQRALAA